MVNFKFSYAHKNSQIAHTCYTFLCLLLITAKDEEPISLTKLVSHHQLANLSKAVGSNWRKLGSLLGIPEQKLENISATNKLEHNKGKEMLYEWKKTIDDAATKELQEKLKKMGMGDLLKFDEGTDFLMTLNMEKSKQ